MGKFCLYSYEDFNKKSEMTQEALFKLYRILIFDDKTSFLQHLTEDSELHRAEFLIRNVGINLEKRTRILKNTENSSLSFLKNRQLKRSIHKIWIETAVLPDHSLKCHRINERLKDSYKPLARTTLSETEASICDCVIVQT